MLKLLITMASLLSLVVLSGCSSTNTPNYLDGKMLKDMSGCVFIAKSNVGDTMFLRFSKELSDKSCEFKDRK